MSENGVDETLTEIWGDENGISNADWAACLRQFGVSSSIEIEPAAKLFVPMSPVYDPDM